MSILSNGGRVARFTSSQIHKLMGTPAPRKTYIEEKKLEKKLGRPLTIEKHARQLDWGHFCEIRVHNLLGTGYVSCGHKTIIHPNKQLAKYWSGSPDQRNDRLQMGAEVKCYEPKKFAQCVDAFKTNDLEIIRKECASEYWQGISNAILLEFNKFQWIFYMPYESELMELAEAATNWDGDDQYRYRFIFEAVSQGKFDELPYLPDGGYYKNLNIFERNITAEEKKELTNAVITAGLELDTLKF